MVIFIFRTLHFSRLAMLSADAVGSVTSSSSRGPESRPPEVTCQPVTARRNTRSRLAPGGWAPGGASYGCRQRGQAAGWQARQNGLPHAAHGAWPAGSVRCSLLSQTRRARSRPRPASHSGGSAVLTSGSSRAGSHAPPCGDGSVLRSAAPARRDPAPAPIRQ